MTSIGWRGIVPAAALLVGLLPGVASAQGNFDGTWTGQAGDWKIRLVVKGQKGLIALTCTTIEHRFDIPVAADGVINSWLSSQTFGRRQVAGKLPHLIIPTGGSCKGGSTNLSR